MILSQAHVKMSIDGYDGLRQAAILMEHEGDMIVDSIIEGGAIKARHEIWFDRCVIRDVEWHLYKRDSEVSKQMSRIINCTILGTILPDAFYSDCLFK